MELATLNLDTYKVVKLLQEKGYTQEQAEGFITAVQDITLSGVATKQDIQDIRGEIQDLRNEMSDMKSELIKLIYINTITTIGVLTGVIAIAATAIIALA